MTAADPVHLIELWLWEEHGRPNGCAGVLHEQAVLIVAELERHYELKPRPCGPKPIDGAAVRRAAKRSDEPSVLD